MTCISDGVNGTGNKCTVTTSPILCCCSLKDDAVQILHNGYPTYSYTHLYCLCSLITIVALKGLDLLVFCLSHSFPISSPHSVCLFSVDPPQDKLCLPHHILEEKGMIKVSMTVQALVDETSTKQALFT